ncbi:uncharacterized protein ccdc142 isoform X2 [Lampris incognitus]|uniref:uncharacterized protein ccdc142 isoform X2 n=1 Tax=Lampris incognitus TaxID=2546036 RepID=UPI0024B5F173|nr:uncharacterized protein ccdc142 isoform X2 [Lampris incognitus]
MRQVLDSLGLQALVLMEHLVYVTLSHLAQTWFESVPREVLDDILAGTELYNQAVEEYRQYHSATLWRTVVLHQTDYYRLRFRSPSNKRCYPAAFPVKELMRILAIHHGKIAAKQLHHWASQQTYQCCEAHLSEKSQLYPEALPNQGAQLCCGASMWTWKQLEYSYPLITFNRPQPPCDSSLYPPPHSSLRPPPLLHSRHLLLNPHPNLDGSVLENVCPASTSVQQRPECPTKGQTRTNTDRKCQSYIGLTDSTQTDAKDLKSVQSSTGEPVPIQTSLIGCYEAQTNLNISEAFQTVLPPSHSPSFLPLSGFCQQDQSSLELLFQALVSSSDLLAPLVPQTSTTSSSCSTAEMLVPKKFRADKMAPKRQTNSMSLQGTRTDSVAPLHIQTDSVVLNRLRAQRNPNLEICQQEQAEAEMTTRELSPSEGKPEEEKVRVEEEAPQEQELFGRPCSVQWLDLSQTSVCADLFAQYRAMLWPKCSQSFWLHLHFPPASGAVGSINLWNNCKRFQLLHILSQASKTGLVLKECSAMLEDFRLLLSVSTAHAHWDHGPDGVCGSRLPLLQSTVSLALASVQTSTLWVMSKAYQFLSSWTLNKFLLITQGDLKVLRMSLESLLQQTETLIIDEDHVNQYHQHHQHHPLHQALLRQQIGALRKAVSKLQGFSSLALKIFSTDCKRMSEEIFEQTMPPAKHWRLSFNTGFPSSPSEYASLAAQSVIGQVLEGVAPLSDDARIQALSVTMTAFMEAWMEHILKQKIRFSIQGALQLKQDFDSIRELIQSDQYSLSTELHQRLLSLRVFQQVDSAVVCLLQQPQAKPYLQSTGLELCRRCCPTTGSRSSIDTAVGGSITNLESMEGEALNQFVPSLSTSDNPTAGPNPPGEPYLAPSFALGAAQQEWLDLRVHSSSARWRLPGFSCLSKSEP